MKRNFKKQMSILCILYILFIQSCIVIRVPNYENGYSQLTEKNKEKILFLKKEVNICEIKKDDKIYAINGDQLHKCLKINEKSMVYFWTPHSFDEFSYPLLKIQSFCDSLEISLYVITKYYYRDTYMYKERENIALPLFSINNYIYNPFVNYDKQIKLFKKDLIKDIKLNNEILNRNIYIFNYGKLISYNTKLDI